MKSPIRHQKYNNLFIMNCVSPVKAIIKDRQNLAMYEMMFGNGVKHIGTDAYIPFREYIHRNSGLVLREEFDLIEDCNGIQGLVRSECDFAQGLTPREIGILREIGIAGGYGYGF